MTSGSKHLKFRPQIISTYGNFCWFCKTTVRKLEIHHMDFDHYNNVISNLRLTCRSCHTRVHDKGRFFRGKSPMSIRRLADRICPVCDISFRPRNSKSVFCSVPCKNKHHSQAMRNLPDYSCIHCFTSFRPRHAGDKYCSPACSAAYQRRNFDRSCKFCKRLFRPRSANRLFCSPVCYFSSRFGTGPRRRGHKPETVSA